MATGADPLPPPLLVRTRGAATELVLNRPERKNALNRELVVALGNALRAIAKDDTRRVVVLRGAGGSFCSGADLRAMTGIDANELEVHLDEFHVLVREIAALTVPVVAVVEGPAVGFGADLALACDLRLFAEGAYVEESFAKIGLMPDGGGTLWMPSFVGSGRAFEILALGSRLDAAECARLGIANRVVAASALDACLEEWTTRLVDAAPLALARIKGALRESTNALLEATLAREKKGQLELLRSADFAEGVQAFLEKRPPRFEGR